MKTARKVLVLALCAILLVSATIMGTMAYLTSEDDVTNTFTVGKVKISLDEALVNENGEPVNDDGEVVGSAADAERVAGNEYHLLPGHTYTKDPTVTVLKGSEESYIRAFVQITVNDKFDEQFPNGIKLENVVLGLSRDWNLVDSSNSDNVYVYEFRYKETVAAPDDDITLDALFDGLKVPDDLTNEQMTGLDGLKIEVQAQAIQADGFDTAAAAWAVWED